MNMDDLFQSAHELLQIMIPVAGFFFGLSFSINVATKLLAVIQTVHNAQKDKNESKNPEWLARPSWHEDHLGEEFYYENQLGNSLSDGKEK